MKNSIYYKKEVPSIHPGCRLAETGRGDYDDFDNPLKPLDVIPEEKKDKVLLSTEKTYQGYDEPYVDKKYELLPEFTKPSYLRSESLVTITVPEGIHPITFIKPEVINHAWIIFNKEVVEEMRKVSYKFKHDTVAYGEFFRLLNDDSYTLQKIEYFEGWRILRECEIDGIIYQRPDIPEFIIEMVL